MPRIVYTIVALLVLAVALGYLGKIVDPEGIVWFAAFLIGVVLVSLTDRRRFGWIHPDASSSARSVPAARRARRR